MTLSHQQASLEKVTWSKVRKDVHKVNPELAAIIDEINPGEELPFYRAKYPFGATILDGTTLHLPTDNGAIEPINSLQFTKNIQEELGYTGGMPVGLLIKHSIEFCLKPDHGILPWTVMKQGRVFGLWRGLEINPEISYHNGIWLTTAGSASSFILPHIGDIASYKKLSKARNLKRFPPRNMQEQCAMLSQMSKHPDFLEKWYTELIFFSNKWFINHKKMLELINFFQQLAINNSAFWRNKFMFDLIWDSFVKNLYKENINIKPYIVDIVKHIITIALGELPGFAAAINDDILPATGFQNDLLDIYNLKNFSSTIMVPKHFDMHDPHAQPVYWSLQLPYYLESMPKPKGSSTLLDNLLQIYDLLEAFTKAAEMGKLSGIVGTPIETCIQKVNFTCFHSDIDSEGHIQHLHKMPKEDPTLLSYPIPGHKNHQQGFSDTTPFARGCVRISIKT